MNVKVFHDNNHKPSDEYKKNHDGSMRMLYGMREQPEVYESI